MAYANALLKFTLACKYCQHQAAKTAAEEVAISKKDKSSTPKILLYGDNKIRYKHLTMGKLSTAMAALGGWRMCCQGARKCSHASADAKHTHVSTSVR
jgi:hypothetical protein